MLESETAIKVDETVIDCHFDLSSEANKIALLSSESAAIPSQVKVYAHDLEGANYVLLAQMTGLSVVRSPRMLSLDESANLIIRQGQRHEIGFTMENYMPDRTSCWLDGGQDFLRALVVPEIDS